MENRRVNFSIKQVILGAFILLVVIPTMLIIYLAISQYSKNMSEQVILQKENLLNAIGINLEEQLKSFENMSMLIYYNTDAMDELDQYEKELFNQEVLLLDVQNILNSMVNSDKYVSAAIITINEGIFSAGQTYQDFDILKETYEEQVYEEKGRIVYLPTQNLVTTYGVASRCFIIARAINSWDRTLGIQWLFISESVLSQNFDGYLSEGDSILTIVDKKGNVISSSNQDSIGTQINEMEIVETLALETYSVLEKYTDKKIYISSYIHDLKWTLIEENSYEAVYGSIHKIWNMGLILLMLFSSFSILMIYIIEKFVFFPLTELKSALGKITEGDFTVVLRKKREDEIGSLIDSYSKMTMQIENLMLEVRKEEQAKTEQKIKVLSMQIGPHFVYNTLNSIKWLAVINNQTNIKRMIESLIDLMMSVTYNTDEKIALQKEIELLESYCYIQKMRYSNFNLNIDASEELRQYKINKLILQPIVENSILYGFSKSKIHGNIWVKVYKTQNSLWVEVKDDGNGFESEKITDIWEKEQTDNQHIGLKNVRERIRLSYGEPYDLFVESEIGEGTVVTLRLPLLNDSKESE